MTPDDMIFDFSVGEKSTDWEMRTRLRVLEILFTFESSMTLEQVTRHLAGVNPLDTRRHLRSLEEQSLCTSAQHTWKISDAGLLLCHRAGLVPVQEWQRRLKEARDFMETDVFPRLPAPHIRHFEWRFSPNGLVKLADCLYRDNHHLLTTSLGALNTPVFGLFAWKLGISQQVAIYDSNDYVLSLVSSLADDRLTAVRFDARDQQTMRFDAEHHLVVMDPPWFPEYYARYIEHVRSMIADPAYIYAMLQPQFTQPNSLRERATIMREFLDNGFVPVDYLPEHIDYLVNPFERETFAAADLHIAAEWNLGDVAVFYALPSHRSPDDQTDHLAEDEWLDYYLPTQVISVRQMRVDDSPHKKGEFVGSWESGVFPSLSGKDERRYDFNVWTSQNRTFRILPLGPIHTICAAVQRRDITTRPGIIAFLRKSGYGQNAAESIAMSLFSDDDFS